MSQFELILAIDQGGQSSRVAVYTDTGEQLCCFSAECSTRIIASGTKNFIEQDGEEILHGIRDCLQKIHASLGTDLYRISAAGFAGQGSSLLCWDSQSGKTLTPVLSWQDIRGESYLQDFPFSHEEVQRLTGLRISPHYGASKMRWCLDHYPAVANALTNNTLCIGPIVSYIFWHLLHAKNSVDPGHAQRTLLWNLSNNRWDNSLLDTFKIPKSVLPECVYHNHQFGNLCIANHKIPFTASARDQGASLFARGVPDKNVCYINMGTGAFIQRVSNTLVAPEGLLVSPLWLPEPQQEIEVTSPTCYLEEFSMGATKNLYAWEATVNGAASAIQYVEQQAGLEITPAVINHALTLNPSLPCYFLNSIGGLSAPYWRTDLQARFSDHLSGGEKILAWIESVIFQIVINVELMNALGAAQKIYISGGFSKSDAVCQKIADLTQTAVYRSDNTDATLQGIACMAAGISADWQPPIQDDVFTPQQNLPMQLRFDVWRKEMTTWLQ